MIDTFALGLAHALMALAAWRLFQRKDLDQDGSDGKVVWGRRPDA